MNCENYITALKNIRDIIGTCELIEDLRQIKAELKETVGEYDQTHRGN